MSVKTFTEFSKALIRQTLAPKRGEPKASRLMGIDWGTKRIGLAQCKIYPPGQDMEATSSLRAKDTKPQTPLEQTYRHFQSVVWPYRILPVHLQGHNDPQIQATQYLQATRKIRRLVHNKDIDGLVRNGFIGGISTSALSP